MNRAMIIIDTHADDYNSQHGKTCSQSIVGELHLTTLIKFRQMKKITNISLIVLSFALLGLWSCNKAQSIENTAKESLPVNTEQVIVSEIDSVDADEFGFTNEGAYNEFLAFYKPWTSRTMAP